MNILYPIAIRVIRNAIARKSCKAALQLQPSTELDFTEAIGQEGTVKFADYVSSVAELFKEYSVTSTEGRPSCVAIFITLISDEEILCNEEDYDIKFRLMFLDDAVKAGNMDKFRAYIEEIVFQQTAGARLCKSEYENYVSNSSPESEKTYRAAKESAIAGLTIAARNAEEIDLKQTIGSILYPELIPPVVKTEPKPVIVSEQNPAIKKQKSSSRNAGRKFEPTPKPKPGLNKPSTGSQRIIIKDARSTQHDKPPCVCFSSQLPVQKDWIFGVLSPTYSGRGVTLLSEHSEAFIHLHLRLRFTTEIRYKVVSFSIEPRRGGIISGYWDRFERVAKTEEDVDIDTEFGCKRRELDDAILSLMIRMSNNTIAEIIYHIRDVYIISLENLEIAHCDYEGDYFPGRLVKRTAGLFSADSHFIPKYRNRKSLVFRRDNIDSEHPICPQCGFELSGDCMKFNMFWRCNRCGWSQGIDVTKFER